MSGARWPHVEVAVENDGMSGWRVSFDEINQFHGLQRAGFLRGCAVSRLHMGIVDIEDFSRNLAACEEDSLGGDSIGDLSLVLEE